MSSSGIREIQDRRELDTLLTALCQDPKLSLYFEQDLETAWSAILRIDTDQRTLFLDVGALPEMAKALDAGERFQLLGQAHGAMLRTPFLEASSHGALQYSFDYPDSVVTTQQRKDFRASLYQGMQAHVDLLVAATEHAVTGRLLNMSYGGCLLEVPLMNAANLLHERRQTHLTIRFPNGEQFQANGQIRHVHRNRQWTTGLVGFKFGDPGRDFERQAAYFIQEIQRQAAQRAAREGSRLAPSDLFSGWQLPKDEDLFARTGAEALTPVAIFLSSQIKRLAAGDTIALEALLMHSHALFDKLRTNRESLLYSIACIQAYPGILQHGIAVAIRLADLVREQYSPSYVCSIIACSLIHDLGKTLLPEGLLDTPGPLSSEQKAIMQTHVDALRKRLDHHVLTSADIMDNVIGMANERLDGSGYPNQKHDAELPELARLMAVVDVADAMRRPRSDRQRWSQDEVYRHLLLAKEQFDNKAVQRYIKRFGVTPVGSLVRYTSGALAWVEHLDASGNPFQVRLAQLSDGKAPSPNNRSLFADDILKLGRLKEIVDAEDFGLKPD